MYRDQFGEFVCGYWGLMVNLKKVVTGQNQSRLGERQRKLRINL